MRRFLLFFLHLVPVIAFSATGTVFISRDTTYSGLVLLDKHIVIRPGKTLTIAAGAELRLSYGINITTDSLGHILVAGTSTQPVRIVPLRSDTYWGSLHAKGTGATVTVAFAEVVGGQIKATENAACQVTDSYLHHYNLNDNPIVLTKDAVNAYIARTHVSNYYEINLVRTPSVVEDCLFEFTTADAIDFDNAPAGTVIRRTTVRYGRGTNIDAIDWGKVDFQPPGSQGRVENCLIHDFSDKGVSVGEGCLGVTVTGTLFYRCGAGVAVKDSSLAFIYNNTIYGCEYGIEAVEKNEGLGGGHVVAYNNIIWNNGSATYLNSDGTISQSYSNVQGVADTTNHILATDPLFVDPAADDFRLQSVSPLLGQGMNGEDLGAIFPVGGIAALPTELALGAPNAVSVLRADSIAEVYWSAGNTIAQVDLMFSSDGKTTWNVIASGLDASQGLFTWAVPNIYSTNCYFIVRDHADTAHVSGNERPFIIEPVKNAVLKPDFSVNSGFFTAPFDVVLSAPVPGATIYYTLDGSEPTDRSAVFQQPLTLQNATISTNHQEVNVTSSDSAFAPYSYVRTSPFYQSGGVPVLWQRPYGDIDRQCVVRSRVYHPAYGLGPVITKSYFIHPDAFNGRWPLPVVSLTTDPDNLFDYYKGIYIPGATFTGEAFTGNYCQSGSAFEYPAHIDVFDEAKRKQISQEIGIRIKGQFIRALGQKPIGLYAKKIYDPTEDDFRYDIFPENTKPGTGTVMNEYKRLLLRQNGEQWSTWENTMCQDGLAQSLLDHCNVKTQAFRPSLVYLNGEFWGIHNIREMIDEENISRLYDIHEDSIIIMEDNLDGFTETPFQLTHGREGDDQSFLDLRQYLFAQNMNDSSRLAYVSEQMDIDNFTDYWIATIYLGKVNSAHNQGYWRIRTPDSLYSSRLGHDGRWRWLAFDFDNAFNYVSLDNFQYAVMLVHDDILLHLFENQEYVRSFVNRYCDLVNSSFKPSRIRSRIDQFQSLLEPVIPYQIARWGRPMSMSRWYIGLDNFRYYADERPAYALGHLQQQFQLPLPYRLTVDVSTYGSGYLQVNSLLVNEALPGVDSVLYPWSGTYFGSVPVKITAYPMPGYVFSHWLETGDTLASITVDTTADVRRTAVFRIDMPEQVRYIYPNPVRQGDDVHLRERSDCSVHTIEGKLMMQVKNDDKFNTSGLPAGVYLIRVPGQVTDRLVITGTAN